MTADKKIIAALAKAKGWFFTQRDKDGFWHSEPDPDRPAQYDHTFIKTVNACRFLLNILPHLTTDEVDLLRSSLYEVIDYDLPPDSPVDHVAFKLTATAYSNAVYVDAIRQQALERIRAQDLGGFWFSYSNTYHFTNYLVLEAMQLNGLDAPEKFPVWAWSKLNKTGDGWGISQEDNSQASITALILLSCLVSGVPSTDNRVQLIVDKLEAMQNPDGGWPASKITDEKNSVFFSTALVILCLLLTKQDPKRKSIQEGMKFILSNQNKDGSWPYSTNDKTVRIFTMNYVAQMLTYTLFLDEADSPQYKFLLERLQPAEYYIYLYSEYEQFVRRRFINSPTRRLHRSRALGSTIDAQARRRDILRVLSLKGCLDDAAVIDALKAYRSEKYAHLKKRDHLTLIKNDLYYLRSLHLIQKKRHKHFLVVLPIDLDQKI